jgi:hypothetical protein
MVSAEDRLAQSADEPYHGVILTLVLLAQFSSRLLVFGVGILAPLLRDALRLSRAQIGFLKASAGALRQRSQKQGVSRPTQKRCSTCQSVACFSS